ncbi:hypothetical protein P885DRAFT_66673 [Corynascus similis CBS 632.67]
MENTLQNGTGAGGATAALPELGKKRKSPDGGMSPGHVETSSFRSEHVDKRVKLADDDAEQSRSELTASRWDKSLLPAEIWHRIFTFCPPKTLGNLLAVNKLFNLYLDPSSLVRKELHSSITLGAPGRMQPNAIWQASRRLFWPQMPAPLRSKTELAMWRLACSPRCQNCGKLDAQRLTSRTSRHPGPGPEGVAAIWAFGICVCATCLLKGSEKEVDLEISPSVPAAIIPALPFVFLTQDREVFSPTTLEASHSPTDLQLTKLFSKSDIEALLKEFLQVKEMGQGTVAEWLKGLPGRGTDLRHEAAKWEKWELSGGVVRMCSLLYPGYEPQVPNMSLEKASTNPAIASAPAQGRHERTAEEAAELKEARKAEIERRCLLLSPPLTAEVLRHIPSFQAATQIVANLDDDAWERLKPRLQAQRAEAEMTLEAERRDRSKGEQQAREPSHLQTTLAADKEARDRIDKEWEDAQAPLRVRIAGYADEVLREKWGKGRKVTRENCSRFAVDSLLYVRARFYADIAKDVTAARAAGKTPAADPPNGPFTQKLTLENMKWIFDTKFKPHTESYRKELFYCNGCEGNHKAFGFEGVIQHYAAKHTAALSLGSIVVHWRAEWPEHPPFCASPRTAIPPSNPHVTGGFAISGGAPPPAQYGYTPSVPLPPAPLYPSPIGYGCPPPTYNVHYPQALPLPQPYQPPPAASPPFAPPPSYEPQPPYAIPPAPYSAFQPPPVPYVPPAVELGSGYVPSQSVQYDNLHGSYPANAPGSQYTPHQPSAYPNLYHTKVDDIARNAREVWRVLGDIRELPGNVRVFVTIHHLVKRFQSRFYETPPLSMFIDGLSNNKEMRPVRNVNGLVCRACRLGLGNAASVEEDRKDFSLPQLANHFQSKHIEPLERLQAAGPPLNWITDMVFVSNVATLPFIASSANEPQKALLSAAFPDAFGPWPAPDTDQLNYRESRQHKRDVAAKQSDGSPDTRGRGQADSGDTSSSSNLMSKNTGFHTHYHASAKPPHDTTPGAVSENDQSVHSDGGRQMSRGPRPNSGSNRNYDQRRATGRFKRDKLRDRSFSGEQRSGRMHTASEASTNPEPEHEHVVRPTRQTNTSPSRPSLNRPEQPRPGVARQGQAHFKNEATTTRQVENSYLSSVNDGGNLNITAALDSRLERMQPPPRAQRRYEEPGSTMYRYHDDLGVGQNLQPVPKAFDQYGDREFRTRSPPEFSRVRGADEGRLGPAYEPRSVGYGRQENMYSPGRVQPAFVEPIPRHTDMERFGLQTPEPGGRIQNMALPEADYHRYREDMRMRPRPPVEAYEIVHIIDEHGEYYIRRPVRREPGARYVYEERSVRQSSDHYPASEPVYASLSRPSSARVTAAPNSRPGDRRADPKYYEEYDPRFPAA